MRVAGGKLLGIHDSIVDNIGVLPTALLESGGLSVAGKGLSALGVRLLVALHLAVLPVVV